MVVQLALIAQTVSVDRFTNRVSIFNLIDTIDAPQFPIFIQEMAFLSVLRRNVDEPSKSQAELTVSVGEIIVGKSLIQIDFQSGRSARQIAYLNGIPVPNANNLKLQLVIAGHDPFVIEIPVSQSGPGSAALPFQPSA